MHVFFWVPCSGCLLFRRLNVRPGICIEFYGAQQQKQTMYNLSSQRRCIIWYSTSKAWKLSMILF